MVAKVPPIAPEGRGQERNAVSQPATHLGQCLGRRKPDDRLAAQGLYALEGAARDDPKKADSVLLADGQGQAAWQVIRPRCIEQHRDRAGNTVAVSRG